MIYKLSHWQEPSPIILLKIDKSLKIGFYHIIQTFSLTVGLKIESGGEVVLELQGNNKLMIGILR